MTSKERMILIEAVNEVFEFEKAKGKISKGKKEYLNEIFISYDSYDKGKDSFDDDSIIY